MKVVNRGFDRTELEESPVILLPDVSESLQRTLARLLGWDETNELWRMLRVDNRGQLAVSFDALKAETGVNSAPSVGTTATIIINSNTLRQYYLVQNKSTYPVYIGFSSGVTTSNGLELMPGDNFFDDVYVGDVYAIGGAVGLPLRVVEM